MRKRSLGQKAFTGLLTATLVVGSVNLPEAVLKAQADETTVEDVEDSELGGDATSEVKGEEKQEGSKTEDKTEESEDVEQQEGSKTEDKAEESEDVEQQEGSKTEDKTEEPKTEDKKDESEGEDKQEDSKTEEKRDESEDVEQQEGSKTEEKTESEEKQEVVEEEKKESEEKEKTEDSKTEDKTEESEDVEQQEGSKTEEKKESEEKQEVVEEEKKESEEKQEVVEEEKKETEEEAAKKKAEQEAADYIKELKKYSDKLDELTQDDSDAINAIIEKLADVIEKYEIDLDEEDEAFLEEFTGKFNEANIMTADDEITADNINTKINQANNGDTITLTKSISADVEIPSGKEITLKIPEGVKLTNKSGHTITNNGTLTITGDGVVANATNRKAALYNKGKLTVEGGTFNRSQETGTYTPYQSGGNSWYTVYNAKTATLIIKDGTFLNSGGFSSMLDNWGELKISGGSFDGGVNTIKNDDTGDATISGGKFYNPTQAVILNWHNFTITGGTFEIGESGKAVVLNSSWKNSAIDMTNGNLTIKGGTFIGNIGEYGFAEEDKKSDDGQKKITITGGDLTQVDSIEAGERTTLTIGKKAELKGDVVIKVSKSAAGLSLPTLTNADKGTFVGWLYKPNTEDASVVKYEEKVPEDDAEFRQSWLKLEATVEEKEDSGITTEVEKKDTAADTANKSASDVVNSILSDKPEAETDVKVKYELVKSDDTESDEEAAAALKNKIVDAIVNSTPITTKVEVESVKQESVDKDVQEAIKAVASGSASSDSDDSSDSSETVVWTIDPDSFVNIDVNMYIGKDADAKKVAKITQLEKKVELSIAIPEKLQEQNNDYAVVRYHDGKAEILKAKKSADGKKVTFESDLFSYYALVYKEAETEVKPDDSKTDDTTNTDTNNNSETTDNSSNNSSSSSSGSGSHSRDKGVSKITGQWLSDDKGWWYSLSNGSYPKDSWYECTWNGVLSWYHFDEEGYADGGWFTDKDGQRYFLHDKHDGTFGAMYTGWKQIVDQWYYFNPEKRDNGASKGSLVLNGVTPDGYAVDVNGAWIH